MRSIRPIFPLVCLAALFVSPFARADEPSAWEVGGSAPTPPPPPPPAAAPPTTFEVEQTPLDGAAPTKMWSPAVFGFGMGFTTLGLGVFLSGVFIQAGIPHNCGLDCPSAGKKDTAFGLMLGGGALLLLGVPMAYYGGRQVPDRPSWAKALPEVQVSPRGGILRWTF